VTQPTSAALGSVVLLAAWLGAALLVALAVAPAAFAVLPTRTLAGALVGRVLPVVFWSGMAVGLTVAALGWAIPPRLWRTSGALGLVVACAAAQLVIAPRIQRIREQIGGAVDALDPSDPRRQAFGRLHGLSVAWMGIGGLAALVALVALFRQLSPRSAGQP
jgi:ABC-type sugar transport system substrate-binding protein